MLTATLGPPVTARQPSSLPDGATEQHIAIHRLQGQQKQWANRLLALLHGKAITGVEWSLKFELAGLGNERFLLGLHRDQWHDFDFSSLPGQLQMPDSLWSAFQADLHQAVMFYASFDATGDDIHYRVYLELPATPDQPGAGIHGNGYKWNPVSGRAGRVTRYRERLFRNRDHVTEVLRHQLGLIGNAAIRHTVQSVFDRAAAQADPAGFMFLDASEAASRRRSFTLTFSGAQVAVHDCVPALLQLARALALPEGDVARTFMSDDPRVVRSLAAGKTREGSEFFTFYYG